MGETERNNGEYEMKKEQKKKKEGKGEKKKNGEREEENNIVMDVRMCILLLLLKCSVCSGRLACNQPALSFRCLFTLHEE